MLDAGKHDAQAQRQQSSRLQLQCALQRWYRVPAKADIACWYVASDARRFWHALLLFAKGPNAAHHPAVAPRFHLRPG